MIELPPSLYESSNFKHFFMVHDRLKNIATIRVSGVANIDSTTYPFLMWFEKITTTDNNAVSDLPLEYLAPTEDEPIAPEMTGIPSRICLLNQCVYFDGERIYIEDPARRGSRSIAIPTNPAQFVVDILRLKLETYAYFATIINADCITSSHARKYRDYFMYVSEEVKVGDNPTFFPNLLIFPTSQIHKTLCEYGAVATPYGVITSDEVVPLFRLVGKPKVKIQHIAIKCVLP